MGPFHDLTVSWIAYSWTPLLRCSCCTSNRLFGSVGIPTKTSLRNTRYEKAVVLLHIFLLEWFRSGVSFSFRVLSDSWTFIAALTRARNITMTSCSVQDPSWGKRCSFFPSNWCYRVTDWNWRKGMWDGTSCGVIRWRTAGVRRFWPLMNPRPSGTRLCDHWIWGTPHIFHARSQVSVQILRFPARPVHTLRVFQSRLKVL